MKKKETTKQPIGIVLLHLVSGENIMANVIVDMTLEHYICMNPLTLDSMPLTAQTQGISFSSLIPMFTGESILIPEHHIMFAVQPHPVLEKLYGEYVIEIIQRNAAAISSFNKTIERYTQEIKKTLN